MSTKNRLQWKAVDAKALGQKARIEARRLIEETPAKAASLADYLQIDPDCLEQLLCDTNPLPPRMTSLLIWGWNQQNGSSVEQVSTLQSALQHTIGKKLLSSDEVARQIGALEQTISKHWLWEGGRPNRWTEMRLEHLLYRAGYWQDPTYLELPGICRELAIILLNGQITFENAAEMVGVDKELILNWLRGNRNPYGDRAKNLQALVELINETSGSQTEETDTDAVIVEGPEETSKPPVAEETASSPEIVELSPVMTEVINFPSLETIVHNTVPMLAALLVHFANHSTLDQREKLRELLGNQMFALKLALVALSSEASWRDRQKGK